MTSFELAGVFVVCATFATGCSSRGAPENGAPSSWLALEDGSTAYFVDELGRRNGRIRAEADPEEPGRWQLVAREFHTDMDFLLLVRDGAVYFGALGAGHGALGPVTPLVMLPATATVEDWSSSSPMFGDASGTVAIRGSAATEDVEVSSKTLRAHRVDIDFTLPDKEPITIGFWFAPGWGIVQFRVAWSREPRRQWTRVESASP